MASRNELKPEDFASTVKEDLPFLAAARVALVIICRGDPNDVEEFVP